MVQFDVLACHRPAMGDVVNLRRVRKRLLQQRAAEEAAANRARAGQTRTERKLQSIQVDRLTAGLDGARLQPGDENLANDPASTS